MHVEEEWHLVEERHIEEECSRKIYLIFGISS
jgi:hypothetical protein